MDNGGITTGDLALMSGNGGFGGNGFMYIFGLLILLGLFNGGFSGWGNNGFANAIGYENLATSNEVQRGFDNQNLQAQTRDILAAVNAGTAQSVATTNQTFHDNLSAMQNMYNETARDIAGLAVGQANMLAKQNECCCETKMLIQQSAADNALQMAQMEARINAKMDHNEITALRDQINQLQLAQATSGMLRFPNSWTYGAGPFPPIFGGCCASNI
jgi:hypothetical protein